VESKGHLALLQQAPAHMKVVVVADQGEAVISQDGGARRGHQEERDDGGHHQHRDDQGADESHHLTADLFRHLIGKLTQSQEHQTYDR
jgi:hypothetical protein